MNNWLSITLAQHTFVIWDFIQMDVMCDLNVLSCSEPCTRGVFPKKLQLHRASGLEVVLPRGIVLLLFSNKNWLIWLTINKKITIKISKSYSKKRGSFQNNVTVQIWNPTTFYVCILHQVLCIKSIIFLPNRHHTHIT